MTAVQTIRGSPYVLKAIRVEDGRFLQHAVIRCYNCHRAEQFIWTSPDSPTYICKKFQQQGWEIYKNGKARCPEHKQHRIGQKAHFAKLAEVISMPELVKSHPAPEESKVQGQARTYLLIIDEDGNASIRQLDDVQEMMFGDVEYIVVPK